MIETLKVAEELQAKNSQLDFGGRILHFIGIRPLTDSEREREMKSEVSRDQWRMYRLLTSGKPIQTIPSAEIAPVGPRLIQDLRPKYEV
ncbi:MAG TPA: hypothetical protein VIM31_01095 [Candidatus Microsaccharimonas sp.]|jgi:hypothetical protein